MMKRCGARLLSLLLGAVLLLPLFSSCGSRESEGKETETGQEDVPVDYSDFSPGTLSDTKEYTYSTLTSFLSDGYVADAVRKNISDWLLTAYEKNPGIIDVIRDHSLNAWANSSSLSTLLNDGWNRMGNGISTLTVSEKDGKYGKSLLFTHLKKGAYTDVDFIFGNTGSAVTDWRKAKTLWVYLDMSEYGNEEVPFGIAMEEYDTDGNGSVTGNRETWGLKVNGKVTLYPANGEKTALTVTASGTANNNNRGRAVLPAGFVGWMRLALDEADLTAYWNYPEGNGKFDRASVHQFTLNLEGVDSAIGKAGRIGPFLLSGETADTVPSGTADSRFTRAVNLDGLQNGAVDPNAEIVFVFYGEFPGKLLTGMSYAYRLDPSDALKKAGDELTDALADAQYEDGYLGIFDGDMRLGGNANWDTWTQYHIICGLLQWYRVTGNEKALSTAVKLGDFVMRFMAEKNRPYSYGTPMCNLGIAHGFALLYEATKEDKYLKEAEKIIENDWDDCGNWLVNIEKGMEFYQMTNNYGQRWEPLHSVMALGTVARITGNERYRKGFEDLYQSILKTDRRNTGAFSCGEGACGDLYSQANGVESCCSIAWMALTADYLADSCDSLAADEAELSYYNTMLGSMMEDGREIAYNTPSDGTLIGSRTQLAFQTRSFSPDFSCCQANSARGLSMIADWAVLNGENRIFLNWYGASEAKLLSPAGQTLVIRQITDYPVNGKIRVEIDGLAKGERFDLLLRVPSWASSFTVTAGGKTVTAESSGIYLPVSATWQKGMTFDIAIGMTVHYMVGQNDTKGKTSVYYGPVLLALDTAVEANLEQAFSAANLADMKVRKEDGYLLTAVAVNTKGVETGLISFADVSRGGSSYRSWLNVHGEIESLSYERGGTPIWCAGALS